MKDFRIDFLPYIATVDGCLVGLTYEQRDFAGSKKGDHAHCELCWATICDLTDSEAEKEGYCCRETGCWLCKRCFYDFSQTYNWHIIDAQKE